MRAVFGLINPAKVRSYKQFSVSDLISTYELVMEQYKWGYWELMSIPIPVFVDITEAMIRRFEKEKKAMKNEKNKSWGRGK